jgi:hypothetical protein
VAGEIDHERDVAVRHWRQQEAPLAIGKVSGKRGSG